nr:hypothetical protein [uncultured Noviherbaspirillum sp.]
MVLPDVAPVNAIPRIIHQTFSIRQLSRQIREQVARLKAMIATIITNIDLYLPNVYGVGQYGVMRVTGPIAYANSDFCQTYEKSAGAELETPI